MSELPVRRLTFVYCVVLCSLETVRAYLKQLREAIALRLPDEVFADGSRSKWWMFFAKRKFMNKELQR